LLKCSADTPQRRRMGFIANSGGSFVDGLA
jgi:hypothetical protein